MSFRTLIICCLFLALSHQLQLTHQAVNSSNCLPPGLFNATVNTCTCVNGSIMNISSGQCECPSSLPWLNNSVCTVCNYPNVYLNATNVCYICPNGYTYSIVAGYCIQINCPTGLIYNASVNNCTCPSSQPYQYNNTCNLCPQNNYISKGNCIPCWNGSYYNQSINGCQCNQTAGMFPSGPSTNSCIPCYYPHYFNEK